MCRPCSRPIPSPKIWLAGCSHGEEVYSIAILLEEEGLLERTIVYAADISPSSLTRAESGPRAVFARSRTTIRRLTVCGRHGATMRVESNAEAGTCFEVRLPRA